MKILVFDYDGVIADSLRVVLQVNNEILAKYGLEPFSQEEFLELFDKNFYESLLDMGVTKLDVLRILPELRDGLLSRQEDVPFFPGMKEVLAALSSKNIIYVVTSNVSKVVEDALEKHGISGIKAVIGAEKETSKLRKLLRLKEKHKKELFYVGDTKGDVYEGKQAGVQTVAVTWGYHDRERLESAKPDFIVDTPDELKELLLHVV